MDGRGMVMLQKFPLDRMDREATAIAYLGIGTYIGKQMIQNQSGHVIGHGTRGGSHAFTEAIITTDGSTR